MNLARAVHARFADPVASEFIAWLNKIDELLHGPFGAVILPHPSAMVRKALGEDMVDELLDFIVAKCDRRA